MTYFYKLYTKRLRASGCTKCALASSRTRIVVDRGTPGASLLLIGEAPGAEEDKSGLAFVGAAGKLLDKHLGMFGITPDDYIIANIIKCRPPDNAKPSKRDIAACIPYLWKQIALLNPEWIVLLGATAFESVLGAKGKITLSNYAGKFLDPVSYPGDLADRVGNARVFVQYHPSAALHDPSRMRPIIENWRLLFEEIKRCSATVPAR